MNFSDWNLVCLPNTALLRAIVYSAYVKQKIGIRSEEVSKNILTYVVPKPFDQIRPLTDSNEATEVGNRSNSHDVIKDPGEFPVPRLSPPAENLADLPCPACNARCSRICFTEWPHENQMPTKFGG